MTTSELAHKKRLGRGKRALRLIRSTFDPRAWLHLIRIVNFYNYSHVQPLRQVTFKGPCNISPDVVWQNPKQITLGQRVSVGSRCHIWGGPSNGKVIIGDDVLFGPEVMLTAATYRHDLGSPVTEQPMAEADIVIGDDVWLATRAIVLPGTTIGSGSIVAAGAVVKGVFPPMSIIAGSPARVVSTRVIAEQDPASGLP